MRVWKVKRLWVRGMSLWPLAILIKDDSKILLNHEKIHWYQQKKEGLKYYIKYLIEWIKHGYRNISYEREAFENQRNFNYIDETYK